MILTVRPGLKASREIVVDRDRTIPFMGEDFRVYATPEIVWDAEMACRDLLLEHLAPGYDSVGVRVEIDHRAPGIPGSTVRIDVTVEQVEGRRATFSFEVRDAAELIGTGHHQRVAVAMDETLERLAAKRKRLAACSGG